MFWGVLVAVGSEKLRLNWTGFYALAFRTANVVTLVGLPPTPCGLDRCLQKAEARCTLVMSPALATGTRLANLLLTLLVELCLHFSKS